MPNSQSDPILHPIQVAARRSGLSPEVIRAWERRYSVVSPHRSGTNRRLYSDEDVVRLVLLAQATRKGRRIGDIAGLETAALRELIAGDRAALAVAPAPAEPGERAEVGSLYDRCIAATEQLDAAELERVMAQAVTVLSPTRVMDQLLVPFMHEIGERWQGGTLRVANEHMATSIMTSVLSSMRSADSPGDASPEIIVASPKGQRHEFGGLMAAVAASSEGWKVTYLGGDLPAIDIVSAASARQARAIALSIIFPADDSRLPGELQLLRTRLGDDVAILIGGGSAPAYGSVIEKIDARLVGSFADLREELRELRSTPPPA